MVITDPIALRQLRARKNWVHPRDGLRRARVRRLFSEIMPEVGASRSWRDEPFRKYFEDFQAALFTFGITHLGPRFDWQYSYGEKVSPEVVAPWPDADCYLRCNLEGTTAFKPIQLKELVPEELTRKANRTDTLQTLIDGLARKYTAKAGQEMLVVGIYVNRATTINVKQLRIPSTLAIQQLWFFGLLDGRTGFVSGGNPRKAEDGGFGRQIKFSLEPCLLASDLSGDAKIAQ